MSKRDDYEAIAGRLAARLLDNACPHGGGGHMGNDCHMCVVAALRTAAREGAQAMKERTWERHVREELARSRRGPQP